MHPVLVRFVASEVKATIWPSAEMDGWTLSLLPWVSSLSTEAQDVLPSVRLRTKIWANPLSHSEVRLVALDWNATKRPSPEILARPLVPLLSSPLESTETHLVWPVVRSCTKTCEFPF